MPIRRVLWCLVIVSAALASTQAFAIDPPTAGPTAKPAAALPQFATSALVYTPTPCGEVGQPLAFAPDGTLAMGCPSGSVQITDPITTNVLWETAPNPKLERITFIDKTLVTVGSDRAVILYDTTSHAERLRFKIPGKDPITKIQAAANTLLVITVKPGKTSGLTALSLTDGSVIASRSFKSKDEWDVGPTAALSADGLQVAWATSLDNFSTISWTPTKDLASKTPPHFTPCKLADEETEETRFDDLILAFSPDTSQVASVAGFDDESYFCLASLADPSNQRKFASPFRSGRYNNTVLQFSPDGQRLRVMGEDMAIDRSGWSWGSLIVDVFDLTQKDITLSTPTQADTAWQYHPQAASLPGVGPVWAVAFNSNGSFNALFRTYGDRQPFAMLPFVKIDAYSASENRSKAVANIAVSPDGRYVLAQDTDRALIWNITDPTQPPLRLPFKRTWNMYTAREARFSTDSQRVLMDSLNEGIELFDITQRPPKSIFTVTAQEPVVADIGPNVLAVCTQSYATDPPAPPVFEQINTLTGERKPLAGMPPADTCPPASDLAKFLGPSRPLDMVPSGTFTTPTELAATGTFALTSKGEGEPIDVVRADTQAALFQATYPTSTVQTSPDRQWLVLEDPFRLLHIPTFAVVPLKAPSAPSGAGFSPDNKRLLTLHADQHTILTWDLAAVAASVAPKP